MEGEGFDGPEDFDFIAAADEGGDGGGGGRGFVGVVEVVVLAVSPPSWGGGGVGVGVAVGAAACAFFPGLEARQGCVGGGWCVRWWSCRMEEKGCFVGLYVCMYI